MRAIITKPVIDTFGNIVFDINQVVNGRLMQTNKREEHWADIGSFIVTLEYADGKSEYAVECGYFKRPFLMRVRDFWSKK